MKEELPSYCLTHAVVAATISHLCNVEYDVTRSRELILIASKTSSFIERDKLTFHPYTYDYRMENRKE